MSGISNFEETFRFLEEGDEFIRLSQYKNVSLILGKSGSGKSTFTQYVVGDDSKLFSEKAGVGKFIIKDSTDDTGSSSISKTIFPKLYEDDGTQTAYYDCPGFADNRNVSMDIASSYFIKKVVDSAENIKLVLTVSYNSLSLTVDRGEHFKSLLVHASTLIGDVDKYKGGISLIATKVPKQIEEDDDGNMRIISDAEIIEYIADFLQKLRPELKDVSPFNTDEKLHKNSIVLIDTLLEKEGKDYQKIGLFKMPTKAGRLSEIKAMQNAKKPILKIFNENTLFVPLNSTDFGYSVSDSSKNEIKNMVQHLNKKVVETMGVIANEVKEHFRYKADHSKNIYKLEEDLNNQVDLLNVESQKSEKFDNLSLLISQLSSIKEFLQIEAPSDNLRKLSNYKSYFDFFQSLSNEKISTQYLDWIEPLRGSLNYVKNLKLWYNFLVDSYAIFGSYSIQNEKAKYNVKNLNDWGQNEKPQGIQISRSNLKTFLEKAENIGLQGYKELLINDVEDTELSILNEILQITLKENPEFSCISDKLTVKGDFVRFSEVSKVECKSAQSIDIFALNTVYIDETLNKTGKNFKLSIIAPKWYVDGAVKIILDGHNSESNFTKPAAKKRHGERGTDGVPGIPGGSSGSFFGIGNEFVNSKALTITANGGDGSNGQDGGDGTKGEDGKTPEFKGGKTDKNLDLPDGCFKEITDFKYKELSYESYVLFDFGMKFKYTYDVYGTECENGGNGGDGGSPGIGGNQGGINMIGINDNPQFTILNSKGNNGAEGIGGKGGEKGNRANTIQILAELLRSPPSLLFGYSYRTECIKKSETALAACSSGKTGVNGQNTKGIRNPDPPVKIENPSQLINNYKVYLQNNTKNRLKNQLLSNFYKLLNENSQVVGVYDTLGLIHELKVMENELYKFRYDIDLIPIYESLLLRIQNYAKNPKSSETSLEHRKVLGFLYSATLSKICALREDWESNLITDIKQYLDAAATSITELKEAKSVVAVEKLNKNYKTAIDQKVEEANEFIETQISKEIDNIDAQMQNKIDDLVDESLNLQNQTRIEINELRVARDKIEDNINKQWTMNVVKGIGKTLGIIGPIGSAIGTIVDASTSIAETFVLDDEPEVRAVKVPEAAKKIFENTKTLIEKTKEKDLKILDSLLEFLKSEGSDDTTREELRDTSEVIQNARNVVNEASTSTSTEETTAIETVTEHLEEKEKEKGLSEKAVEVIGYMKDIAEFAGIIGDLYDKYKKNQTKFDEAKAAIQKSKKKFHELKAFEKEIFKTIIPLVNGMKQKIDDLQSDLPSKSLVALDVSKWQIQSSLKDLKFTLRKFTEGFKAQAEIVQCVEKLIDAMNTLIGVYDRIQNYQEQKSLADYLAHLSSASVNKIPIKDEKLSLAMTELQVATKSNVILSEYENVMSGVKQYIFPFVELYLDEFKLPSDLNWFNSTDDLVYSAVSRINELKVKLIKSDTSITKHDKFLFKTDFNPKNDPNRKPFYVWKNDISRSAIHKLFAGQGVSLKADIARAPNLNAVKFNSIDLHFQSNNTELQQELLSILEKKYHLQITHSGNSYYKCKDKTYLITSKQQKIQFSFSRNADGSPKSHNEVYLKIKEGNPMLSPYSMWNIQLLKTEYSIGDLQRFGDAFDLQLVGYGQYVNNDFDCNRHNLENFYQLDYSSLESSSYEDFSQKQKRSTRSVGEGFAHNSAGSSSSFINKIINRVKRSFLTSKSSFNGYQEYINNQENAQAKPKETKPMNPSTFYQQVDSVLILVPVIHHVWKKFFNKTTQVEQEKHLITIDDERVKNWKNFFIQTKRIMAILDTKLGHEQPELNEYNEVLSTRAADMKTILSQPEVDSDQVDEFERNLIAFEIDLMDDVDHNPEFSQVSPKSDVGGLLRHEMNKLNEIAEAIPDFKKKYQSVKLNYKVAGKQTVVPMKNYGSRVTNYTMQSHHLNQNLGIKGEVKPQNLIN